MKQVIALFFALSTFAFSPSFGSNENVKHSGAGFAAHDESQQGGNLLLPYSLNEEDGMLPGAIRIAGSSSTSHSFSGSKKFVSPSWTFRQIKCAKDFFPACSAQERKALPFYPLYLAFRSLII